MHHWGDEGVDWEGISAAARYIGLGLRKWGRVGVCDYKEKFGTVRVYCSIGWYSLLSVTHPGWMHYGPYPKWLSTFDIYHGHKLVRWMNFFVVPYHKWLYRRFYKKAIAKWPHLKNEILNSADWHELLKGL